MRICLISLDYKPYRSSGLTFYAEDLSRGFLQLGHYPVVIAAQRPGLPKYQKIHGIFPQPRDRNGPCHCFGLFK